MSLISYRPSDKRSPGKDPRLQYAFENQVLGVSCISHRLTQLAAFFIDQRTEWSTVCSCTAYFQSLSKIEIFKAMFFGQNVFAQIVGHQNQLCRHCTHNMGDNNWVWRQKEIDQPINSLTVIWTPTTYCHSTAWLSFSHTERAKC